MCYNHLILLANLNYLRSELWIHKIILALWNCDFDIIIWFTYTRPPCIILIIISFPLHSSFPPEIDGDFFFFFFTFKASVININGKIIFCSVNFSGLYLNLFVLCTKEYLYQRFLLPHINVITNNRKFYIFMFLLKTLTNTLS